MNLDALKRRKETQPQSTQRGYEQLQRIADNPYEFDDTNARGKAQVAALKKIANDPNKAAATIDKQYGSANQVKPRVGPNRELAPNQRLRHHIPTKNGNHFNTRSLSPALGRKMAKRRKKKTNVAQKAGAFVYKRAVQGAMWWVCTFVWVWQIMMFALFLLLFTVWAYLEEHAAISTVSKWAGGLVDWWTETEGAADAINNFSINMVLLPWFLSALGCLAAIAVIALALASVGKPLGCSPLRGQSNSGYILFAIIGYSIFIFLPIPWAMPWLWHTYTHPRG